MGAQAPLRASLRGRPRGNGLTDDTWVPLGLVEERIVTALLQQLCADGVPALRLDQDGLAYPGAA